MLPRLFDMNKNMDKEKTEPGVSSAITPDGSVANKFSSPPTGNILSVGYKSRLYPCSGITLSANTFNPEAAFFPAGGYRNYDNGALLNVGAHGDHWSSSPGGSTTALYLGFYGGLVFPAYNDTRAWGLSVRCVKEFIPVFIIRNCFSIFYSRKNRARSFIRDNL
jgi:hypothetical protein